MHASVLPSTSADQILQQRFLQTRRATVALCATLQPEDTVVQSMADTSPTKWHLAHTTWFFEQFLLARDAAYVRTFAEWSFLFNSYYQSVGPMHARVQRGLLSRPTLAEVLEYRERIDERVVAAIASRFDDEVESIVTLGIHHEQQHQELLLTDIKHAFSLNPLAPVFRHSLAAVVDGTGEAVRFLRGRDGIVEIGHAGAGFAFDSETPRHRLLLHPHAIADRPVDNAEFRAFIEDGGYRKPALWMAEGWNIVQAREWSRPLYWHENLHESFTLAGMQPLDPHAPVCHVSFFEADAYARWIGARLPLEGEWEALAEHQPVAGNFVESGRLHPVASRVAAAECPQQMFGDVWEWTGSPYVNYPSFRPLPGALGEYNGKFMSGQWVLRGGSCCTPADHMRASYRNFFYPADRWQFSGVRLAKDL